MPYRITGDEDLSTLARKVNAIIEGLTFYVNQLQVYENNTGLPINDLVDANKDSWSAVATNFDTRNDRISTVPADPVISADGSAVDHTINTDGSANISVEWENDGSGDAYNIDGFIIWLRSGDTSGAYVFGTNPAEETDYYVSAEKRATIFKGLPADKYYTFGVQAYRMVDQDINADGILKSAIVQPALAQENPYQPSANVAFAGDVTGSIDGKAVSTEINITSPDITGNASDGTFNSVGNVTWSVTADQGPVVKQFDSFTLNAGHTLTVDNRCKGLILLVKGDVNVSGTISMNDKAARVTRDTDSLPWVESCAKLSYYDYMSKVVVDFLMPAGGSGGSGGTGGNAIKSNDWAPGGGPGGSGGTNCAYGGSSGGGGGGGAVHCGPGSQKAGGNGSDGISGGGPGGSGGTVENAAGTAGVNGGGGGGGIIVIIAKGNITINPSGIITAKSSGNGGNGGNGNTNGSNATCGGGGGGGSGAGTGGTGVGYSSIGYAGGGGGGGGAGGGIVLLVYGNTYINNGSINVNGSIGGSGGSGNYFDITNRGFPGSNGSDGSVGSIFTVKAVTSYV